VIKFDVEGVEVEAIRGALQIIEMYRPLIVAECFRRSDFGAISELLKPLGYISDGKNWCVSRTCIWEPRG
jgi:hypothetical protein